MNDYFNFAFIICDSMVKIKECNFGDHRQRQAIVKLMNHYMADEMGGRRPSYSVTKARAVVEGLEKHPSRLVLLAEYKGKFVGLCNCFINFATFTAKPFINIHDVVVLNDLRGLGIGRKLMEAVEAKARELGCGKITLEVRSDNLFAQQLYKSMGFHEDTPVMHFWSKYF
jgi:ribosomal protein S18 acetylase RimI-like enzyme